MLSIYPLFGLDPASGKLDPAVNCVNKKIPDWNSSSELKLDKKIHNLVKAVKMSCNFQNCLETKITSGEKKKNIDYMITKARVV